MQAHLLNYLEETARDQLRLLQQLVLQSSHSLDKPGVDAVGALIRQALSDCDLDLTIDSVPDRGDNLVFRSPACREGRSRILMSGHMDTVFPPDSTFNFFREDAEKAYGPGVIDMKGGLVVAVFALKALQRLGLLKTIPLVFICSSDEEMGSLRSTPIIKKEAAGSFCGLVFECGGLHGEIVTGRKGKAGYHLQFFGKAGHAAFTGRNGKASAILELAHKTILLEQLNAPEKEIVVNVGRVEGGAAANIVAEKASCEIDIRYVSNEDGVFCKDCIDTILATPSTPGTRCVLTPTSGRFPMEPSKKNRTLFEIVKAQGKSLGIDVSEEFRSGVSDANTLAECGLPVIDGLGPVGDYDHSENEYMAKSTLLPRAKLATLSLIDIWNLYSSGELRF